MASITELACGCQSSHSCCLRYPEEPQKQIHLSWCFLETQTVRNPPHPTPHPATCYGGLSALREPFKAPKGEPVSRSGLPRGSGMDDLRRKRQMAVRQWSLLSTDCTPTLSGRPFLLAPGSSTMDGRLQLQARPVSSTTAATEGQLHCGGHPVCLGAEWGLWRPTGRGWRCLERQGGPGSLYRCSLLRVRIAVVHI